MPRGRLADLVFKLGAKTWRLWGRSGETRELELAGTLEAGALPVLIGSGLGVCLETLLEAGLGPVAVVDRERAVWEVAGVRARYEDDPRVLWLDGDAAEVMDALEAWREERGGGLLQVLAVPLYLRLDREHYRTVAERIAAGRRADFWARAKYPKFASTSPRILVLERNYFLYREIRAALSRMGIEHQSVPIGDGDRAREGFVEDLLKAVVEFKPDFVLTVNHLGMDREGRLAGLLDRLNLPLASWFVDNPHLILHPLRRAGHRAHGPVHLGRGHGAKPQGAWIFRGALFAAGHGRGPVFSGRAPARGVSARRTRERGGFCGGFHGLPGRRASGPGRSRP